MEDLGYEVDVQLLDAADYGVPQHRERLFFIANRIGEDNPDMEEWETHREPRNEEEKKMKYLETDEQNFPIFKKGIEKKPWNTMADAIMDLPPVSPSGETPPKSTEDYPLGPISKYQRWARQNVDEDELDSHVCRGHNMRDLTLYKLLGEGTSYVIGDIPDEHQPYRSDIFQDNYRKQNPKRPSSTVVAHLYKDGHNFIHPTEARSITAREAARLQSFPDSFNFPVSRTQSFKQIGNAVPVLLSQAVGKAVKEEVFEEF
jgi:DNA (cytosine-5)-methyltransferase 1